MNIGFCIIKFNFANKHVTFTIKTSNYLLNVFFTKTYPLE